MGLLTSFMWHRNEVEEAQAKLGMALVSTSWKLSELVYEAEQFSGAVLLYSYHTLPVEDLQEQFDVLWSRVSVLKSLDIVRDTSLGSVMDQIQAVLHALDPELYGETAPDKTLLLKAREDLRDLIVSARRAWVIGYNTARFEDLSPMTATMTAQKRRFENIAALILGSIVIYLMGELYFSSRATRREQQLARAAEDASRAKSQFIANVSHEIRTPLNGILGTATLLAETRLTPEQKEYLNVLDQAGGLLLSTINDVLDFAKLEAGELKTRNDDFELAALMSAVRGLYEPLAAEKGLDLTVTLRDCPQFIHGDGRRLRQVLHNLVSNAIKFTENGSVKVVAHFEPEPQPDRPAGLHIDVIDSGIGIASEEQALVFDPFGQSNGELTRNSGGTGLGLSISRNLCLAMDGHLSLSSTLGQGSTFSVFVPFKEVANRTNASAEMTAEPSGESNRLQNLDVLIVDDTKANRFILRKYLKDCGCILREAESGAEAIKAVEARSPDAILMDVQMPGMDGLTATREILRHVDEVGQPAPSIFGVTANALPHQIEEYLEAGMCKVIPKPVSKAHLLSALTEVAAASRSPQPESAPASDVA